MNLKSQLAHLENAQLVRQVLDEEELAFIFKHVLLQNSAYESLLKHDRPRLHLQVANAIERLYPDRLQGFAALLGQHFALAGECDKGVLYLRQAAQRELARYAYAEAAQHLEAALAIFEPGKVSENLLALLEEAEVHLNASLRAFEKENAQIEVARTRVALGETFHQRRKFSIARDCWSQSAAQFASAGLEHEAKTARALLTELA